MIFRQHSPRQSFKRVFAAGAAAGALTVAGIGAMGLTANAQSPKLLPPAAAGQTMSIADLVEEVSPSVVSILVEREVETPRMPSQLEEFFQFRFRDRGQPFDNGPRTMQAQGSGFFIDKEGHIVTNNHVVEDAESVSVRFSDGEEYDAQVIGTDPETDLAVLKLDDDVKHSFVEFADDVTLRVGETVVAVGNPFGLSGTVTSGIISAIGREGGQFTDFIQIDAPINRGNSGGPTFDLRGRVVGVNTAIYSTTGGSVGIGFAIPAKTAKATVEQLIKNGAVTRGWLGVSIQDVTTEIAAALGRKEATGALVAQVLDGTPAAKSGFEDGDLVLTLDGRKIEDARDLTQSISALAPGDKAKVRVLRDGKEKVLNVTLGKRDPSGLVASNDNIGGDDQMAEDLGLRVTELDDDVREQFRVPDGVEGVLVTGVRNGSAADEAGLRNGVVILQVDGDKITNAAGLRDKIETAKKEGRDAVLLRMQLGENKQFGALALDDLE
ncbi:MAG: Do family serine endopeptidase [Pseudomonadota bacterium]